MTPPSKDHHIWPLVEQAVRRVSGSSGRQDKTIYNRIFEKYKTKSTLYDYAFNKPKVAWTRSFHRTNAGMDQSQEWNESRNSESVAEPTRDAKMPHIPDPTEYAPRRSSRFDAEEQYAMIRRQVHQELEREKQTRKWFFF